MALLEVRDIYKTFGKTEVLKGVSFDLEEGEALSVIGSSGNGKTTLLRCLNFLEIAEQGTIFVREKCVFDATKKYRENELRQNRLHFGLVFQDFNLFPQYTALKNVQLAMDLQTKTRYYDELAGVKEKRRRQTDYAKEKAKGLLQDVEDKVERNRIKKDFREESSGARKRTREFLKTTKDAEERKKARTNLRESLRFARKKKRDRLKEIQNEQEQKEMRKKERAEILAMLREELKAVEKEYETSLAEVRNNKPDFKAAYEENAKTAKKLLMSVGLADKLNNYPCELSGGQCQRVAIARAMALKPDILCFDEPTSALDPELTGEVLQVIKDLKRSSGITMIIVTHEMEFARNVSDKVLFLSEGKVLEYGTPAEFFKGPKTEAARQFLMNRYEGADGAKTEDGK